VIYLNRLNLRKLHQYLGLLMLLPFIAWAITGLFFFIKPGYQQAYASLPILTYPLTAQQQFKGPLPADSHWLELRQVRTVLGLHLLVKNQQGWQQLQPESLQPWSKPSTKQVVNLVNDAISKDLQRYGQIKSVDGLSVITTTDVRISLNWAKLTLYQQGKDTDFINSMYDIHYLRWTGHQQIDQILGVIGLGLVMILAFVGVFMFLKSTKAGINKRN
jgi:uncharacterized iron-regulated membrane protein